MKINKYILIVPIVAFNISTAICSPYIPKSGNEILLVLEKSSQRSKFNDINSRLKNNENDSTKLITILQETITYGKNSADPRYIGFASSYVNHYLEINTNNTNFKILKASILQHDHKFNAATTLLDSVINDNPNLANARLLRANTLLVQAKYDNARKDCYSLLGKASHLITLSCIAQIDGITKNTEQNYIALSKAIQFSTTHSPAELSWAYDILAQLALQLGKKQIAENFLKQALALTPNNSALLNAYADILLSDGKYSDVINLIKFKKNDFTILLRLTIAEKHLSTTTTYKKEFLYRMNIMQALSDFTHQREIAVFYLNVDNDTRKALSFASKNWNIQKELFDAYLILKCAVLENDRNSAKSVIDWFVKNSITDIRLTKLINTLAAIKS